MVDRVTPEERSAVMRAIRSKHTKPELAVRRLLHAMGYRFRLHASDLKGKPDVVFRKRRAVVFVHGCYWHGHDCRRGHASKSNLDYWSPKIARTQARDATVAQQLSDLGWRLLVVWECETDNANGLRERLTAFLGPPRLD